MSIDALFDTDPFDHSADRQALFVESFRSCARVHYEGNAVFRAFWDEADLYPEQIRSERDLERIPPILVTVFKDYELITGRREDIVLTLSSSGTSGRKSRILLDSPSLARVRRLAYRIYERLGMTSEETTNTLCLSYDPEHAREVGTAFTEEMLTGFTPRGEVFHALRWDPARDRFFFDEQGAAQALHRFARSTRPTRILGFPALLRRLIESQDLRMALGSRSWVLTGGGWKLEEKTALDKSGFRALIADRLGVPRQNIRDSFGLVEHGIPYCDCAQGRLHVPNYARVFIRSQDDLQIVPEGQVGLIHLLCSYLTSFPSISLLTTDWGRLGRCDCGLEGPALEVLGRAGVFKHKGCALNAGQYLR